MRISFFAPRCTPDNSHGRYVIELAKRLVGEHAITIYSGVFWPPLRSMLRCRFLPIPNRPAIARLASLWAASFFVTRRRPSDVVHIQGADAAVGNVVTAHCCNAAMRAVMDGGGSRTRRLNYSLGITAERYCFTKASTRIVIAVSHKVEAEIQSHYGLDAKRTVVVPLGVDGDAFHPRHRSAERTEERGRIGVGEDDFLVLFVGGDYRLKGLVPLLKAAAVTPHVKIVAVGVKADPALTQIIRNGGLESRVKILGATTDIAPLYGIADCFALPTRYDTFSLATLEAMASGLPVIVSRAAGVTELLNPEVDSLVLAKADDVDAIAHHLSRLTEDANLRLRLGQEARNTAERNSWEDVATRTVAAYREALAT